MFKKIPSWHEMDKGTVSITTIIEEYLATCRLEGKSSKTIRGYREKLLRFTRAVDGSLADFKLPNVRSYIASVQSAKNFLGHPSKLDTDEPVSTMTVRNHIRILTAFAVWLEREEYTASNILARLRPPKAPKKAMQTLTPEETSSMLACFNTNTATGCKSVAIVCLFLDTGLCCAGLIQARLPDLHLEDGWLKVMGKG